MTYQVLSPTGWFALLSKIKAELAALDEADKQWLHDRIAVIGALQRELDNLFRVAGGTIACADCAGTCCGCGRHHITLTNLLSYLIEGEDPPPPDFAKTCPYLGENGCCLPVARRPYNCITFFCEQLEENLDDEKRRRLRELDQSLREAYQAIEDRYRAASLRGIWIALERIGEGQILISND
jgi:hypothetical protein